jgi:hypothetical protein
MAIKPTDAWTRAEKDASRAILLEPSPLPIDCGELIGRDPRKVTVEEFGNAGLESNPVLRVIRGKCLDCCGEQESEVRKCVLITCALWPCRMGANPFHTRELTAEQRAEFAERARALRRPATGIELKRNHPKTSSACPATPSASGSERGL